ncbi:MAG: penicillin-binding protein activator, partial [Methylobacter sp.]
MRPKYKPPLLCALLPGLLFFSGCAATNPTDAENMAMQERLPEHEVLVTQPLIRNDQPGQMVELYQHPSTPSSLEQNQQRLQSVESLIQAG